MSKVSVIIPARNEAHLQATVDNLLAQAAGEIEIIPVLDGVMANGQFQPLRDHPQVKPIRKPIPEGMRPAINDAARVATGEYLMKCDAHVLLCEGYDALLKADCDADWLVVPTRHGIETATWTIKGRDFNYSALTYPALPSMYGEGFHAVTLPWDQNKAINRQRAHLPIDDILSAQGSLWFQHTNYFLSFPPLDHATFYFYQESQEVMGRVLASGGRCVVNKRAHYGHWHKGNDSHGADGRLGRGFFLDVKRKRSSEKAMMEKFLANDWPRVTRTFESLVEQHWWLISQMTDPRYAWPTDWREWRKHLEAFHARRPEDLPAHT